MAKLITEEEIINTFKTFDEDNSGTIELDEFKSGMNMMCPGFDEKVAESLFKMVDEDGSKNLTLEEFKTAIRFMERQVNSDNIFIILWNKCDEDGNGVLDFGEFCKIWRSLIPDLSDDMLTHFFQIADVDGNGTIDFNEYMRVASIMEEQLYEEDEE